MEELKRKGKKSLFHYDVEEEGRLCISVLLCEVEENRKKRSRRKLPVHGCSQCRIIHKAD